MGNFFGMDFLEMARDCEGNRLEGCFQANPPFASNFIESMCHRMHHFLMLSNEENSQTDTKIIPLMFIIFVPVWKDSAGWKTLNSSPYLAKHVVLCQNEDIHYYTEGTQHRRRVIKSGVGGKKVPDDNTRGAYRIASFDTSVFFLQNTAAKRKWPLSDNDVHKLKSAFAMKPDCDVDVDCNNLDGARAAETGKRRQKSPNGVGLTSKSHHHQQQIHQPRSQHTHKNSAASVSNTRSNQSAKEKGGSSNKKKPKLISCGNDELRILDSIGIL